jgi:hypothetical protein
MLSVDRWPDATLVPAFGPRMMCTSCGIIGADAWPRSSGAFADYHGLLFFAGGERRSGAGARTDDEVEAFDTKGNRWLKFASLPAPRHGFAAAVADDNLFFIAGSGRCGGGGMMADTLQLSIH